MIYLMGTIPKGYNLIMEISKLIKKTLVATCVWFTVITAAYMLILQIINIGEDSAAVESFRVLLFFLFALLFSIANAIRAVQKLNALLRHSVHYLICAFAFYACFMLPVDMRASFMITGLVIFTVAYAIVVGVIAVFKSRLRANRENSVAYTSQFGRKK